MKVLSFISCLFSYSKIYYSILDFSFWDHIFISYSLQNRLKATDITSATFLERILGYNYEGVREVTLDRGS